METEVNKLMDKYGNLDYIKFNTSTTLAIIKFKTSEGANYVFTKEQNRILKLDSKE
eukprot:CAMPEP_0116983626 /NCGR_PEP_ID=MMETSP0467-20121206/61085_1 /TAXON_ID=283647 /ORGANISM="Mesodinium pulex, Strain SPMC105" /LENGTH=55 /DNA_ID=CAMNT_0004678415 /DNA_START=38 /DNA_END=205 /DNA_ORIENTATION=-